MGSVACHFSLSCLLSARELPNGQVKFEPLGSPRQSRDYFSLAVASRLCGLTLRLEVARGGDLFYSSVDSVQSGYRGLATESYREEILQMRGGGPYANEKGPSSSAGARARSPDTHSWSWSDQSGHR